MSLAEVFEKTVLGIDNSTNSTAYALFKGKQLIDYGEYKFPGKNTFERLVTMAEKLAPLKELAENVDVICIEKTAMINNRQTVIFLAMAAGAAIALVGNDKSKVLEVSAMTYQSFIGNKAFTKQEKQKLLLANPGKSLTWRKAEMRKIRKQRTMDYVNAKFNIEVENDNISDAIALTYYVVSKVFN